MCRKFDSVTQKKDSTLLKLTEAQQHQYQREIACYRGMFGGTNIAMGDLEAWAALRATVPNMAEVDQKIASYRRWERAFVGSKRRAQSQLS